MKKTLNFGAGRLARVFKERKANNESIEGTLGKDLPIRIVSAKRHASLPKELICEIEWKTRPDGIKPNNSFLTNTMIKKANPTLLVDFYEDHLIFPDRKKK